MWKTDKKILPRRDSTLVTSLQLPDRKLFPFDRLFFANAHGPYNLIKPDDLMIEKDSVNPLYSVLSTKTTDWIRIFDSKNTHWQPVASVTSWSYTNDNSCEEVVHYHAVNGTVATALPWKFLKRSDSKIASRCVCKTLFYSRWTGKITVICRGIL